MAGKNPNERLPQFISCFKFQKSPLKKRRKSPSSEWVTANSADITIDTSEDSSTELDIDSTSCSSKEYSSIEESRSYANNYGSEERCESQTAYLEPTHGRYKCRKKLFEDAWKENDYQTVSPTESPLEAHISSTSIHWTVKKILSSTRKDGEAGAFLTNWTVKKIPSSTRKDGETLGPDISSRDEVIEADLHETFATANPKPDLPEACAINPEPDFPEALATDNPKPDLPDAFATDPKPNLHETFASTDPEPDLPEALATDNPKPDLPEFPPLAIKTKRIPLCPLLRTLPYPKPIHFPRVQRSESIRKEGIRPDPLLMHLPSIRKPKN